MLTYTIAEYITWRTRDPVLLFHDMWCMVATYSYEPHWESTFEVERIMRMKPEGGGVLYATK